MKQLLFLFSLILSISAASAQLSVGIVSQKTQKLYWENGLGADYTSDFLLDKRIHLKAAFVTSRLGSALNSNAIKQESYTVGADYRFFRNSPIQLFAGLNAGYFKAHYEEEQFDVIPSSSPLLQFETGLSYHFVLPVTFAASFGYNVLGSDGTSGPGTLFPVFYQMKVLYRIK